MSSMSDLRTRAEKMRQEFFKDDTHKDWFTGHNIFNDEKIQNFFNDERRPDFFQKSQKHEFVNNSKKEDFYHHTSEGNLDDFEKLKQKIFEKRSFPWDYEWGERGNVEMKRNEHKNQQEAETKSGKEPHKNTEVDDECGPIPNGQRRKSLDNLFSKIRDLKSEFQKVEKKLRNAREDLPQEYQDATSEPGLNRGQHQHHLDNMESQSSRSWLRRTPEEAAGPNLYREQQEYNLHNKEPTSSRGWMHGPPESPVVSRTHRRGHQMDESNSADTQSSRSWVRRPSEQDNLSWRSDRNKASGTNRNVTIQTSPHESNTYTDTKPPYRSRLDNTTRTGYTGYTPMYENSNEINISNSYRHSYDNKPAYHINDSGHDNTKQPARFSNKTTTDCDEYGISSERRKLNKTDYYPGKISGFPPPSARLKKVYSSPEQTSAPNSGYEKPQQNKMIPVKINLVQTIVKEQEAIGESQKENKNKEDQNEAVSTVKIHDPSALHCNPKQVADEDDEFTSAVSSPTYPFQSGVSSNAASMQETSNPHESIHAAVTRQEKVEDDATLYPFPEYDAKEKSPSSYTDYTETLSGVSSPIYGLGTATEMSESHSGLSSAMDGLVTGTHSGVSSPIYSMGTETHSRVSSPTYSMGTDTHSRVCSPTYDSGTATELSDTHSGVLSPTYTEFSEIESGISEQSELESIYKTATDCSTSQTSSSSSSSDSSSKSDISAYHIDLAGEVVVTQKEETSRNLEEDNSISQNRVVSAHTDEGEDKKNIVKDESISPNEEKIKEPSFNPVEDLKVLQLNNEKRECSCSRPKKESSPLNWRNDEQPTVISVKIEKERNDPITSDYSAFNSDRSKKYSPDPGYNSNSSSSTIRSPSLCHSETYVQMPVVHSGVKGRVEVEKRVLGSWQVSWNTVVREQQVTWDVNNVMDGNNRIRMGDDKFSWIAIEYIYQN